MRRTLLIAALSGLLLAGCAAGTSLDLTPRETPEFVALAASADLLEVESGRLALARSRDAALRAHAELMIRDHQALGAQLRLAAGGAGLSVPAVMLPVHRAMLDALAGAPDFDSAYRLQQRTSHEQALRLMIHHSRHGQVAQLRGAAAAAVPVIRSHLDHLRP